MNAVRARASVTRRASPAPLVLFLDEIDSLEGVVLGLPSGWLVIFDRRSGQAPSGRGPRIESPQEAGTRW